MIRLRLATLALVCSVAAPFTVSDVAAAARANGLRVTLTTMGPQWRVVARSIAAEDDDDDDADPKGDVVGWADGFLRPGNVLHYDTMQVVRRDGFSAAGSFGGGGMGGSVFGVGLLLGTLALRHGADNGCTKAELMAIHDSDLMHKVLIRHYRRMGFATRYYVGDDLKSVPDRLLWGGCGTRMDATVPDLVGKWTGELKELAVKGAAEAAALAAAAGAEAAGAEAAAQAPAAASGPGYREAAREERIRAARAELQSVVSTDERAEREYDTPYVMRDSVYTKLAAGDGSDEGAGGASGGSGGGTSEY